MKNNNNGFTKSNNAIMKQIFTDTDATCYAVYMAILSHRNTQTNECFPSRQRIMEMTQLSEKTIKRKINELYDAGFIKINTGKQGVANNYYFPKEDFYSDWELNDKQLMAQRKKKAFKAAKKETVCKPDDDPFADNQTHKEENTFTFEPNDNPFD